MKNARYVKLGWNFLSPAYFKAGIYSSRAALTSFCKALGQSKAWEHSGMSSPRDDSVVRNASKEELIRGMQAKGKLMFFMNLVQVGQLSYLYDL